MLEIRIQENEIQNPVELTEEDLKVLRPEIESV